MSDLYAELEAQGRAAWKKRMAPKKREPGVGHNGGPSMRQPSERDMQKAVAKWLRQWGCLVSATENELNGAQNHDADARIRLASAAKARGKTPGWPDLTVITKAGRVLFIEMKAQKGRLSEKQRIIHATMRERGVVVIVGRTIEGIRADLAAEGIHVEVRQLMGPQP